MTRTRLWLDARRKLLAGVVLLAGVAILGVRHFAAGCTALAAERLRKLPHVMIWAWERPEDLRFLPNTGIGVSFLAETVILRGQEVLVRPRLQVLKISPGTPLMACARIEIDPSQQPALSPPQRSAVCSAISQLGRLTGVLALQVDFDATSSERLFYAQLLRDLRRELPPSMPLSITALTSWCTGDPWIAGLPIDEAVPMLFRMGPDGRDIRLRLEEGRDFTLPMCRDSVGISTDEAVRNLPSGRRLYVFRPDGWTPEALRTVLVEDNP